MNQLKTHTVGPRGALRRASSSRLHKLVALYSFILLCIYIVSRYTILRYHLLSSSNLKLVNFKGVEQFFRRHSPGSPPLPSELSRPPPPPPPTASTVPAHIHGDSDYSGTVGDVAVILIILIVFDIFVLGHVRGNRGRRHGERGRGDPERQVRLLCHLSLYPSQDNDDIIVKIQLVSELNFFCLCQAADGQLPAAAHSHAPAG